MARPKTYFRPSPTRVAHLLVSDTATRCGKPAGAGARFDAADLPSGERTFRLCLKCSVREPQDPFIKRLAADTLADVHAITDTNRKEV